MACRFPGHRDAAGRSELNPLVQGRGAGEGTFGPLSPPRVSLTSRAHSRVNPEERSSNPQPGGNWLHAAAFDDMAAGYDAAFTHTLLGSALRAIVWSRLDDVFPGPRRILELGCGTGEDAVRLASRGAHVLAIDASADMVRVAREKAQLRGLAERIDFQCLPIERLATIPREAGFDGCVSNFGALNCVTDLPALVAELSARLAPGARLLCVLMGRHVPWEWAWYLLRGDPRRAWRRLRGPLDWRGLTVFYPTPKEFSRLLAPAFRVDRVGPLGVALPPSYAAGWLKRHPRILRALTRVEHAAQGWRILSGVADHYIVEATRLSAPGASSP
jgi:SAM-dependent methyltransferase